MVELDSERFNRLERSVKASTSNSFRKLSVAFFSVFIFLIFAFTTDIPWHLQTFRESIFYWDNAILNGILNIYIGGVFSFGLTVIYSIVSGLVLTGIAVQLKYSRVSGKSFSSILPGLFATGCASCGVGLASFIGLTGVAAALPFQGDLLKLAGLALLVYALHDIGDPETCKVSFE